MRNQFWQALMFLSAMALVFTGLISRDHRELRLNGVAVEAVAVEEVYAERKSKGGVRARQLVFEYRNPSDSWTVQVRKNVQLRPNLKVGGRVHGFCDTANEKRCKFDGVDESWPALVIALFVCLALLGVSLVGLFRRGRRYSASDIFVPGAPGRLRTLRFERSLLLSLLGLAVRVLVFFTFVVGVVGFSGEAWGVALFFLLLSFGLLFSIWGWVKRIFVNKPYFELTPTAAIYYSGEGKQVVCPWQGAAKCSLLRAGAGNRTALEFETDNTEFQPAEFFVVLGPKGETRLRVPLGLFGSERSVAGAVLLYLKVLAVKA